MTKRKDIHRPSAIIPADYDYVGIEHQNVAQFGLHAPDVVLAQRAAIDAHMKRTGGTYSTHEHKGNCHICGAHCIYTVLFHHRATNVYIRTGMDCAAKMGMGDERLFRAYKDGIEAAKLAHAGKLKAQGVLQAAGLQGAWDIYQALQDSERYGWAGSAAIHAGLIAETEPGIVADWYEEKGHILAAGLRLFATEQRMGYEESVIWEMVGRLVRWGSLSPKQMNYLPVLLKKIDERPQRQAKYAAEKAAAQDVPEGRLTLDVEVLKTDWRDDDFGGSLKMLCKALEGGYTLWGRVPSSCHNVAIDGGSRPLRRGDRIRLTAKLQRSDKDPKFGFFSRPYGVLLATETATTPA